jgi:lipopolysaccharide/colanic/teichoic acid biosynthesis glycosyltransferase
MSDQSLLPTSKSGRKRRFSILDVVAGALAPLGAFALRDTALLYEDFYFLDVYPYVLMSCAVTALVTAGFRLGDILPRYFSFSDAVRVAKAASLSVLLSGTAAFFLVRLDNIPRPTLVSQWLLLMLLLITGRAAGRHIRRRWRPEQRDELEPGRASHEASAAQNAIVVGAFPMTSTFLRLVEESPQSNIKVVLVLDPRPKYIGRTIAGYVIGGTPQQLESLLDEYGVHGISIDRIFIAAPRDRMRTEDTEHVFDVCGRRGVHCGYIADMLSGIDPLRASAFDLTADAEAGARQLNLPGIQTWIGERRRPQGANLVSPVEGRYLSVRRTFEILIVLLSSIVIVPLSILMAAVVLVGIGRPIMFWQQRIGRFGRAFPVYKFRTLKAPFDATGRRLADHDRLNLCGRFIRATRLDELPQLYNVLLGNMSLIGPRPLLPIDLPKGDDTRLAIRPGLTGWAQVNGGKLLSIEEKNDLDKYYISNVSLKLDAQIILKTFGTLVHGDQMGSASTARLLAQTAAGPPARTPAQPSTQPPAAS